MITRLKNKLNETERKLLIEVLDKDNLCDYLYAEEAYLCGVHDAFKNKE